MPGVNGSTQTVHNPILSVNNIEVIYNHVILVLKGVSLKVPKGGITALLGGNGAGKTTTMRSMLGRTKRILCNKIALSRMFQAWFANVDRLRQMQRDRADNLQVRVGGVRRLHRHPVPVCDRLHGGNAPAREHLEVARRLVGATTLPRPLPPPRRRDGRGGE